MGNPAKHRSALASVLLFTFLLSAQVIVAANSKYADALNKTLLFFEAQRSGYLPKDQRVTWRGNSGLQDGFSQGVDLVGGYYDAGDNVKFGLPMAFAVTMLSWAAIDYEKDLEAANQLQYTLAAIRWGTNYFIKAHAEDNVLWCQVGNPFSDHTCWMRPEDMTTPRPAFKVDSDHPGSDVAGETAAAMAAASIAFRPFDSTYSQVLLSHAKQLFTFADRFRGQYDQSVPEAHPFYPSGGYNDELLWAAAWLYRATSDDFYMKYLVDNSASLGGTGWAVKDFRWGNKYAGVQTLMAKVVMDNPNSKYAPTLKQYQDKAEYFMCACMQKNGGFNVPRTQGGVMYFGDWANLHYVSAASFVLATYSEYLTLANAELNCPDGKIQPQDLARFAQSQADYILGSNPMGMSYLVGFGPKYPIRIHHRAASILPRSLLGSPVGCLQGFEEWFKNPGKDPNVLFGALVGGPNWFDHYTGQRGHYEQSEPSISGTASLVGLFAKLDGDSRSSGANYSRAVSTTRHFTETRPKAEEDIEFISTITNRWTIKGIDHYRHKVIVKNRSEEPIKGLLLRLENLSGPAYGLSPSEDTDVYTFPPWISVLKPGASFVFVYVQDGPQARISVVKHD